MLFYAHYTLVRSDRALVEERETCAMKDSRHRLQKLKCVGKIGMTVSRHVLQPVNFVIVNFTNVLKK